MRPRSCVHRLPVAVVLLSTHVPVLSGASSSPLVVVGRLLGDDAESTGGFVVSRGARVALADDMRLAFVAGVLRPPTGTPRALARCPLARRHGHEHRGVSTAQSTAPPSAPRFAGRRSHQEAARPRLPRLNRALRTAPPPRSEPSTRGGAAGPYPAGGRGRGRSAYEARVAAFGSVRSPVRAESKRSPRPRPPAAHRTAPPHPRRADASVFRQGDSAARLRGSTERRRPAVHNERSFP